MFMEEIREMVLQKTTFWRIENILSKLVIHSLGMHRFRYYETSID